MLLVSLGFWLSILFMRFLKLYRPFPLPPPKTFNSLYEIQPAGLRGLSREPARYGLSILFMRFWVASWCKQPCFNKPSLSILFMRFSRPTMITDSLGWLSAFNSLYEIPHMELSGYLKITETFNSLYEIHIYQIWGKKLPPAAATFNSLYEIHKCWAI